MSEGRGASPFDWDDGDYDAPWGFVHDQRSLSPEPLCQVIPHRIQPITTTHRCAWPTLRPTPLKPKSRIPLPTDISENSFAIERGAGDILRDHGIVVSSHDIDIFQAQPSSAAGDAATAPTLVIVAKWADDSADRWRLAVQAIGDYVASMLGSDDRLAIDMIAHERVEELFIGPILDKPELARAWPAIRAFTQQRLDVHKSTKSKMTTIAMFHMGPQPAPSLNPVTLYISVDWESDELGWPEVIRDLDRRLSGKGWCDIHIHIEHNAPERYPFPLCPITGSAKKVRERMGAGRHRIKGDYQEKPNMGESIGASKYLTDSQGQTANPSSGTLGCFVDVQRKGYSSPTRYALTNYHVIRPGIDGFNLKVNITPLTPEQAHGLTPEEQEADSKTRVVDAPTKFSKLWDADLKGFSIRKCPDTLVESPARIKHEYTLWDLGHDAQALLRAGLGPEDADFRATTQKKADKLAFFDRGDHKLGRVVLASGFHRRTDRADVPGTKRRLDWALLEVGQDRQGRNLIPAFEVWKDKYPIESCPPKAICGTVLESTPGSLEDIEVGETVWKVGSTTGPTAGYLSNEFKHVKRLTDDEYLGDRTSVESVIFGHQIRDTEVEGVFALPGDSGAVVFNKEGVAVGLVFTGQRPSQVKLGLSYVTPLQDVFDDIMTMTQSSPTQLLGITLAEN